MCANFISGTNARLQLISPLQVFWSLTGTLVAIAADESFYILRFDRDAYTAKVEAGVDLGDEGVEEAFEIVTEVPEK